MFTLLCFGWILDERAGTTLLFTLMAFFIFFIAGARIFFSHIIGMDRNLYLEPLILSVAVFFYIEGILPAGTDWIQIALPGPYLLISGFMVFGAIMDGMSMQALTRKEFNVKVGDVAPEIELPDQDGSITTLSSFKNKQNVLLIFVRGDWCPTCHIMLRTYEKDKEKFQKKDIVILALGPDPVGVNREMVQRLGVNYKVLADEKHQAAAQYGIKLQGNNPMTKYEDGIPLPAAFLVDKNGRIRYSSRPDRVEEYLSPETIFPVLQTL